MEQRALVLGAGGNAAFAWEIGLISGMADAGLDVRDADLLIGTSAGARLAVQLSSEASLEDLLQTQLQPTPATESLPKLDLKQWRVDLSRAKDGFTDREEILRRVGSLALLTPASVGSERRTSIESLLSLTTWPSRKLLLVAVEAETGTRTVFDAASGIGLLDAVIASGAVPGIFPPIVFRSHHYFDGGLYSTENADLAARCNRVLIFALHPGNPPLGVVTLDEQLEILRSNGAKVQVIHPDEATEAVFSRAGGNVLDPMVAGPAARAGRSQGYRLAGQDNMNIWK
jgi:NTE family protein